MTSADMTNPRGERTVAQKMGIKQGWRSHLVDVPPEVTETLGLRNLDLDLDPDLTGHFDFMHLFVRTQQQMRHHFPALVPHLGADGKLWLSWPKGRQLGSDLNLPIVIEIGYDFGLVESTCVRIDDTWSGLRFTHPKAGKVYANSYGTLPKQRS